MALSTSSTVSSSAPVFELGTIWAHQAGYEMIGRDGLILSEKWAEVLRTYHGLFSNGFPNMFFMGLTQTGITINVPHMLQEQADHLTFVIKHCLENNCRAVDATDEAEEAWQGAIDAVSEARRPFQESCTPGYYNAEGRVGDRRSAIGSGWYLPSTQFFSMWADWRSAGKFRRLDPQLSDIARRKFASGLIGVLRLAIRHNERPPSGE